MSDRPMGNEGPSHASNMAAKGAKVFPIGSDMLRAAAAGIRRFVGLGADAERNREQSPPPGQPGDERREPWFGPGRPLQPTAPREDVAGRQWDYPTAYNQVTKPRRYEPIGFDDLRAIADNYDLLRVCLETRKDQICKLGWSILPKKQPGMLFRPKADDRCRAVEKFFQRPDGVHFWDTWLRMLMEEHYVLDAATLYKRRDRAGRPYALEVVDGSTIMPLIDKFGRRPIGDQPAFQQILKGMPAIDYRSSELYYAPRNVRAHKVYGYGPVEQILTTVNIGLRRAASQLAYYTEGNVPEALLGVPETWTMSQISEFQRYWDDLTSDQSKRRRARFVPSNVAFQPTRMDAGLTDAMDEWLARIVCYALSLPTLPFVRQQNRATAETAEDAALAEGLAPTMGWLKRLIDFSIQDFHGHEDLELVYDDVRKMDPAEQLNADMTRVQRGIISIDDVRAEMGQEAYGLPAIMFGVGPAGFISVSALKEAIDQGLDKIQPPMDPSMMGMSPEGMPMGEDPLAGAPPELMNQLGAGDRAPPEEEDAEEAPPPGNRGMTGTGFGASAAPAQQRRPLRILRPSPGELAAVRRAKVDPDAQRTLQRFRKLGAR